MLFIRKPFKGLKGAQLPKVVLWAVALWVIFCISGVLAFGIAMTLDLINRF